jgi:hypothetical protein
MKSVRLPDKYLLSILLSLKNINVSKIVNKAAKKDFWVTVGIFLITKDRNAVDAEDTKFAVRDKKRRAYLSHLG